MCWMQPRHWKRCCVKKTNKRENSSSHTLTPWRPNSCEEKSCRKEAEASYVWITLCCMSSSASSFGECKRLVPDGILNVPWLASLDTDLITRSCQPELDANNTCTVCTMVKLWCWLLMVWTSFLRKEESCNIWSPTYKIVNLKGWRESLQWGCWITSTAHQILQWCRRSKNRFLFQWERW